ncbi:2'-5' RNA ligase family protein [Puia dinghuensis]|uniref:2'-5' RNA ligase family protein n=1 Tax=Puia dinghuensis TaxID=1792502 RepID=UPI00166C3667|nr:2'-5' RNA ligase family protein [Puia dinghuensis]
MNQQVLEWKRYMLYRFNCKKALRLPAHITLIPPFNMPSILEVPLGRSLEDFTRHQTAFSIYLKNFSAFAPRVIYVHVEPGVSLLQLKADLEDLLLENDLDLPKKEERPFQPHITIASRDLKKGDFAAAQAYFSGRSCEAQFETGAVSLLRNAGERWEVVGEYPFGDLA